MPLLKPRDGENDGGYAVQDYRAVDPRLGTMATTCAALADALRGRGISLCLDLVLNHVAREHAWARAARAGDPAYRDYFHVFPDRTEPDAYERTLPEVFPDFAPGSFTCDAELDGWVWTTFNECQWDLNWSNPAVLVRVRRDLLDLANLGVEVLRLDAIAVPLEAARHQLPEPARGARVAQALRARGPDRRARRWCSRPRRSSGPTTWCPTSAGTRTTGRSSDLAYHNQLMVQLWSMLAARDVGLPVQALRRRAPKPRQAGWVTYVRCHDDIGWAISDEDAWAVGLDPAAHRRFLSDFYAGRHPGSLATGLVFQDNPATGDARTSGAAASLAGLDRALASGVAADVQAALDRSELIHAVAYSFGGIPLVYMGDEIALRNDPDWAADPEHADDNRWLHRPSMDWAAADRRHIDGTPEARLFGALTALGAARRSTEALRSDGDTEVLETDNRHVLAYRRTHPRAAAVVCLANFSDDAQSVSVDLLHGLGEPRHLHSTRGRLVIAGGRVQLEPWSYVWVTG